MRCAVIVIPRFQVKLSDFEYTELHFVVCSSGVIESWFIEEVSSSLCCMIRIEFISLTVAGMRYLLAGKWI